MTSHILHQIEDYVLGLLSQQECQVIEQHTKTCSPCYHALQEELKLVQMVHQTLQRTARPTPVQLRQGHPPLPRPSFWQVMPQQLAPAILILLLFVVGLGWRANNQSAVFTQATPTYLAITATLTDIPDSTADPNQTTQVIKPQKTAVPVHTTFSNPVLPIPNRAPVATPVAALSLTYRAN